MVVDTVATLTADKLAQAFAKGIRNASATWLDKVQAHAMQVRPVDGPSWANPATLNGTFLFRVTLKGDFRIAGNVQHVDEKKLRRAVAVLAATDAEAFARIVAGKGNRLDCSALLQLAVFGFERFPA